MTKARDPEVGDPVYVEWVDASRSAFGWTDRSKLEQHIEGSTLIRSLGFLARFDDDQVSLIHNGSDDGVLFVTNIPRGMVKKIRIVR